jgi:type IV secretion system protein VirD4
MTAENSIHFVDIGFGDKPIAVFIGFPDYDSSKCG